MLISWNVNSVNSRLAHLKQFVDLYNPSVILLQELKCLEDKFPYEALQDLGYNSAIFGQKSYNGVAILSKSRVEDKILGIPESDIIEARYIECSSYINNKCIKLISVYVPQGQDVESEKFSFKLQFFEDLYNRLHNLIKSNESFVIGGDFNVAPDPIDLYNPEKLNGKVGFHIEERRWIKKILSLGLIDIFRELNPETQLFSWWDYRSGGWQGNKGMRIDNLLLTPDLADLIEEAGIKTETRGWDKPSDHAPIYITL